MNAFWALVQNDLRFRKTRSKQRRFALKMYSAAAVLLGIAWYTFAVIHGYMQPQYLMWWIPSLIFVPVGFSIYVVNKEWRSGTAAWWLSMPYSRRFLLAAKFTACVIRITKMYLVGIISIMLLAAEAILIRPGLWRFEMLGDILAKSGSVFLLLIASAPLLIMFGFTLAIMGKSTWRAASPLLWILFIGFMNLFMGYVFKSYSLLWKLDDPADWHKYNIGMPDWPFFTPVIALFLILVFAVILPVMCFLFASYVLERQAEV